MVGDGGGGCILYFAETLDVSDASHLFPSEWNNLETIWAEINLHSQRLLISVMYRPPADTKFYVSLERQLESIWIKRKNIFIMGDLNSDLLRKRGNGTAVSENGTKLLNVITKFGLVNVIKQPTRITTTSQTLIDVSLTSDKSKVAKAGICDTGIADHRLNYAVLRLQRKRVSPIIK